MFPTICEYFHIKNLKDLKKIENHRVMDYQEERKAPTRDRSKLISIFAELNSLYFPPFETKSLTDLPKLLLEIKEDFMNKRDEHDAAKLKDLIPKIESTIWSWGKCSKLSYEYLVCVATLSLFGYDVEVSFFTNIPKEKQLQNMSSMLSKNLEDLTVCHKNEEKQAYVLNIAVSNSFQNFKVASYLLRKMPGTISKKLPIPSSLSYGEKDIAKLQTAINHIIDGNHDKAYKNREKFLSMYFQSIFSQRVLTTELEQDTERASNSFQCLLQALGLIEYYPQKLTLVRVIKLTEEALKDANGKPSSLPELPWYFIRKMLGLNSTARETGTADSDSDLTDTADDELMEDEVIKENVDDKATEKPLRLRDWPWYLFKIMFGLHSTERDAGTDDSDSDLRDTADDELMEDEVIKENVDDKAIEKPLRLRDLFKIMFGLYSTERKSDTDDSGSDLTDTSDDELMENEAIKENVDEEKATKNAIHPLDLLYAVFMCADDFLRQELADKMSKCQYAFLSFYLPRMRMEMNRKTKSWNGVSKLSARHTVKETDQDQV